MSISQHEVFIDWPEMLIDWYKTATASVEAFKDLPQTYIDWPEMLIDWPETAIPSVPSSFP